MAGVNIYSVFPLVATIAYIPLLVMTIGGRPWQRRHSLFIIFLITAILWSFTDYLFRGDLFPQHNLFLFRSIVVIYPVMAVQFHCFTSSFFPSRQGRWLPYAYVSLAVIVGLVLSGYVARGVIIEGDKISGHYGPEVLVLFMVLLTLAARNYYVFTKMLRSTDNPVVYNQIFTLLVGITILTGFTVISFLPFVNNYPVAHWGNLINAFLLSYAVIRHKLVDIKIVLRQGSAWLGLGIVGMTTYWLLLVVLHDVFDFELSLTASFVATAVGMLVGLFLYNLRGSIFELMSRVFHGSTYGHRLNLYDFTNEIHNIFSLKKQGGDLLGLLVKAIGIKRAYLLFPESGGENFKTKFIAPEIDDKSVSPLEVRENSPIINYLKRERKTLNREKLEILPEFLSMWDREKEEIKEKEIELFMPLISRGSLIAILAIGQKLGGMYSLEDLRLLEDVSARVAVSMDKEYLREQLREREEELSVINRCSAIVASSLDIQEIYESFIAELKKIVDISWAAIVLADEKELSFLAISSEMNTDWQPGERVATRGSGTGWVIENKKAIYEPDIEKESQFSPVNRYLRWGLHSVVHLPLVANGEVIGSFIVASRRADAYNQRKIMLLEQISSQIAMPLENARLYAEAEEKARVDALTGLLNRRSLDEMIDSEISRHSRYGGVFSLAILDLDSFKAYNDCYGHPAGDRLLKQVGRLIINALRNSDQAFRYGGDEFAILLPQTTVDAARQVTERVRRAIAKKIVSSDIKITGSIGLASWPVDGIGHTDIIAAADMALYHSKRNGGNRSTRATGTLMTLDTAAVKIESVEDEKTLGAIFTLAEKADAEGHGSQNHLKLVSEYATTLAEAINLSPEEVGKLETCALLHDIGKAGISEAILKKPGKLTEKEWQVIKNHSDMGATMVSRVAQLAGCVDGIRYHHERYDGNGYPQGLKGDQIPLEARILSIADAFASMTSERPYAAALSYEDALDEVRRCAGTQFDPELVKTFLDIYEKRTAVTGEISEI